MHSIVMQAEQTLWTAVEMLATSPDLPEERLRSAWLRVQQVVTADLPERLVDCFPSSRPRFPILVPWS